MTRNRRGGVKGGERRPGSGSMGKAVFTAAAAAVIWLAAAAVLFFAPGPRPEAGGSFHPLRRQGDEAHFENYFRREERADSFALVYGFSDFEGDSRRVTFDLTRDDLRASEEEYGYVLEKLNAYLDASLLDLRAKTVAELESLAEKLIRKSEYGKHISIVRDDPPGQAFKLKVSAPPDLRVRVKAEFDRITRRVAEDQKKRLQVIDKQYRKLRKAYLEDRGLRFQGERLGVDYGLSVRSNRPRIKSLLRALRDGAGGLKLHEFMSRMLAFVQEIRYGLPPLEEEGRYIFEFWPPPKVLVNNLGDCDSKGVLFASLWSLQSRYPLLLIKIPNHMLAGVALPSPTRQGVMINGLRYTLMEVTGPGKYPPGLLFPRSRTFLESGRYYYEMIR